MDKTAFTETVKRLQEVDGVIKKLDPSIRADAFALLTGYVSGGKSQDPVKDDRAKDDGGDPSIKRQQSGGALDVDALVEKHESDIDHENALLALAVYYARHGKGPLKMPALKKIAEELNLTVPDRMDAFFRTHKREGKEVLRQQAEGWKVMPSGESYLKTTYGVTKGKTAPS